MSRTGNAPDRNKVLIITEGGKKFGFGHVVRCTALYDAFKERGFIPQFLINGDGTILGLLGNRRYRIFNWLKEKNKLFELADAAAIVVIDSYSAGKPIYSKISKITGGNLVMLDDCNRLKYPKGFVINSAIYGDKIPYPKKDGVIYLLGSNYAILRKEFWTVPQKRINREVKNILITFGGKNYSGLMRRTAEYLKNNFDFNVDVAGQGNNKLGAVEMLKLISKADVCISGGGQTLYELARCKTPAIGVCLADNQLLNLRHMSKAGLIKFAGWYYDKNLFEKIATALKMLDFKDRTKIARLDQKYFDGCGAGRIVKEITIMLKDLKC